jgi:copper chaperone CopZ
MDLQEPDAFAAVHVTTLQITGMSSEACVRHVTTLLSAREGVIYALVDLKSNLAVIEHLPANVDAAALVAAIRSAGYTARVVGSPDDTESRRAASVSSGGGCGCRRSFRVQPWTDLGTMG